MEELFPMTAGLLCGLLLGGLTARRPVALGLVVSVVVGLLATVLSGEWRISWAYLLIDIPLVAVCAAIGLLTSRRVVLRRTVPGGPPL